MARTVRDAKLETRAARLRLRGAGRAVLARPRKGVRARVSPAGERRHVACATAAAGRRLCRAPDRHHGRFAGRRRRCRARLWAGAEGGARVVARRARREEGHETRTGPFTVADAMADYLKAFERRGGKAVYHARRVAETHILPALGSMQVAKLTANGSRTGTTDLQRSRARPQQAGPETKSPQGRQERRWHSQASRHRQPYSDRPEGRAQSCLEGGPRRER